MYFEYFDSDEDYNRAEYDTDCSMYSDDFDEDYDVNDTVSDAIWRDHLREIGFNNW